jgi:predicted secreted Zn-dependent protease
VVPLLVFAFACSPEHRAAMPTAMRLEALQVPGATLRWYEVEGRNRAEILQSLLAHSPQTGVGAHVAAATDWAVYWHVPEDDDGTCRSDEATVSRQIVVELPAWRVPPTASQAEAHAWLEYVRALAGHEFGHVVRVNEAADALGPTLHGKSCEEADLAGYHALDVLEADNAHYDEVTQYGANQGADFWSAAALDLGDSLPTWFATTIE